MAIKTCNSFLGSFHKSIVRHETSAQRVGFFNIGSGRVLEKIPGSGSGLGRVGVLKYTIGYFRVSLLLSGISGYSWVFPGISGENWISSFFFEVVSQTLRFFSNIAKIHK